MNFQFKVRLIILSMCSIIWGIAQTQELKFTLIEGDQGKPLGKITAIMQDPHGYMWFCGQQEKCLYRYDGNRMVSFRHDDLNPNSLGMIHLETVYADDAGMIWIGGDGLDQYNPATGIFKHYRNEQNDSNSLVNNSVNVILKDHQGRLWVGTDKGLDRLDEKTGKFIHYRNIPGDPGSLSSNIVRAIYEDRMGVVWIGTGFPFFPNTDGGLNRLNPDGAFTRYLHDPYNPHSLINNKVRAIFEDSRGVFWVGTSGDGLHTMDREKGSFERIVYNPAKPDQLSRPPVKHEEDHITFITEDSTGAIWIGTFAAGMNRFNPVTKKITHYQSGNGFPDSTCWNACISRDGVLWICTQNSALLYRVDPFQKFIYSTSTVDWSSSFLEDMEGFLWVGTFGNGLLKFDQHKNLIKQFKPDPSDPVSLPDINICGLFQNQKNSIWVGTCSGLRILNTGTQKFSRFQDGGNLKDSTDIGFAKFIQDKLGFIWCGRWGLGLIRYNPKDNLFKHFLFNSEDSTSIGSNFVSSVLEDRFGVLWVGGQGGINRLNRETDRFKHYLSGIFIYSLYEDSGGTLWAGTEKSLFRYNPVEDKFSGFFDPQSEINSFTLGGIIEDNAKQLWLVSHSAIIKLNTITKETFIYGSRFGIIPNSLPPWGDTYKNAKGQLHIGHRNGFYTFFPEELAFKKDLKIIITDFFINALPELPGKGSPLQKPIEEISDLDLKYHQNTIVFNFTAIDYRAPEAITYFTMLEGYDNTWREVKGEKSSYYFNLPVSKLVFRLKAYNKDGTKGEKTITIRINPPWWKTYWAYGIYSLLLIGVVFNIYRFQKQRIIRLERQKTQARELEQAKEIEKAQAKELEQARQIEKAYQELKITQDQLIQSEKMASLGELTAGIAHEIKNPLNFINNFSEINLELLTELNEDQSPSDSESIRVDVQTINNLKKNSEKINQHGKRVDSIVKGMLQHSRLGNATKEAIHINTLCEETIKLAYHGYRAKENTFIASFETRYDPDLPTVSCIPADISRVLLNIINNALYSVHEKKKQVHPKSSVEPQESNDLIQPDIILTTQNMGNKVSIVIADNGMGIPAQLINKIFQPFFTTKPTGEGTGLGLSLAYDIITKGHQGEIKVNSKEGKGTEFEVILPV